MRVFVGYGYNERDVWIEQHVLQILRAAGYTVVNGRDMHGHQLRETVKRRLDQSAAAVSFFTIRDGQGDADYTSHIWVRDEMLYAQTRQIPIVPVREIGVSVPDGLFGNLEYITLHQDDRLACVAEVLTALARRSMQRVRLDPQLDDLRSSLWGWRNRQDFKIQYRTRDELGEESDFREGRLEVEDFSFFLNVMDLPPKGQVDVVGRLDGVACFASAGWATTQAVHVKIYPETPA